MSKKTLLLGAIASIIAINSIFADTTVTTKDYVDTNFQTKIPTGTTGSVVTYNGEVDGQAQFSEHAFANTARPWTALQITSTEDDKIPKITNIKKAVEYLTSQTAASGAPGPEVSSYKIPAFAGATMAGKFGNVLVVSSLDENTNWEPNTRIPNVAAMNEQMETKQNKMTCTRWLDNADETDENCLLWSIAN